MKKVLMVFSLIIVLIFPLIFLFNSNRPEMTGAPPYYAGEGSEDLDLDDYGAFINWKRPDGPAKVALQVGHWKSEEVPKELERLRGNTGASGGGKSEWEVNMAIAQETAEILKAKGVIVEILPATIPPDYWSDVMISIHADGSEDTSKTGYKAAAPRRDMTSKAEKLLLLIEENYGEATKLVKDPNVTRNMRGYYAFRWWRYEHTIHPMTTAIILETGFLTSPSDRKLIVDQPEVSAKGLADGIIEYLNSENLIIS